MSDAQFATWWDYAKKLDEFRGVSMAAAYAAWLAGIASRHSDPIPTEGAISPVVPESSVSFMPPMMQENYKANYGEQTPAAEPKPKRRAGKYRAEE